MKGDGCCFGFLVTKPGSRILDLSGTRPCQAGQLVTLEVRDTLRPLTTEPLPVARFLQVFAASAPGVRQRPHKVLPQNLSAVIFTTEECGGV